ncbi:hypothetical protein V1514DRAFT_209367 [Lipomyces japonicus]|uniref:uncharacterized protein n=1 Tax=Lipomyces japonicus TaxID=56871 RepID=UPI0034CDBE22
MCRYHYGWYLLACCLSSTCDNHVCCCTCSYRCYIGPLFYYFFQFFFLSFHYSFFSLWFCRYLISIHLLLRIFAISNVMSADTLRPRLPHSQQSFVRQKSNSFSKKDVPPAVAAILAVTAIPRPKNSFSSSKLAGTQSIQSSRRRSSSSRHESENNITAQKRPVDQRRHRKRDSASSPKQPSRTSRQYSHELKELLIPPSVDDDSASSTSLSSSEEEAIVSTPQSDTFVIKQSYPFYGTSYDAEESAVPRLSSSVSSTSSSSPATSPTTPISSNVEYFPAIYDTDSDDNSTLKYASSSATLNDGAISRHRKQPSESVLLLNNDPLCVALDENGKCIPAFTYMPSHVLPASSTSAVPEVLRVQAKNLLRQQTKYIQARKSQQEELDEEIERQRLSMISKINTSIRSLKWIASSMARHQEEYTPKDEIDHLEEPRRSRSANREPSDKLSSKSRAHSHSGVVSIVTKRSQSERRGREHNSNRSLSAGGVTARSTARALTIRDPPRDYHSDLESEISDSQSSNEEDDKKDATSLEKNSSLPAIQLDTYDVQQNCLPIIRPREPRMNGDFLRILAMELEMRRHGKLSQDFYSGKARMILGPRTDYSHLSKAPRKWKSWVVA